MAREKDIIRREVAHVLLDRLRPSPLQPRCHFDQLKIGELAKSILAVGVLQPLLVREMPQNTFEILAGERRYRAALSAKLKRLPCVIMKVDDERAMAIALVENVQREDLNPIEEARGYLRLNEVLGFNQETIAERVGKDRATVANAMRLLRLPRAVQDMLVEQRLSMGQARALLSLGDDQLVTLIAKKVEREGLSVRRVESLVRSIRCGRSDIDVRSSAKQNDVLPMERDVQRKLEYAIGARVKLKKAIEGYSLTIDFSSSEQLNGFLDQLRID